MLTSNDKLNIGIIWSIDLLAIDANLMLIAAILFKTPKLLRTYSVFLLNNAIIDLVSAIASALGTVRTVQDHEGSTIFVFMGPCTLIDERICRLCQALHINLVQHSTIILMLSFAFRLFVLSRDTFSTTRMSLLPRHIWLLCSLALLFTALPTTAYYLEMANVSPEVTARLHLDGYVATNYAFFGSGRAMILGVTYCTVSPIVMTIIFVVRRKLIKRIEQAKPTEKRLHESIARALTYQLLLPCGVAIAAVFWLCDLLQIWSSEFSERIIMITCSIFSLASPLINFAMLPPYRAIFSALRTTTQNVEMITQSSDQR